MSRRIHQLFFHIGYSVLAVLAFLVLWVLFLEEPFFEWVLGEPVSRSPIAKWELVLASLALVGLVLILPFKRLREMVDRLDQAEQALQGERTLSKVFFQVDNAVLVVTDTSHRISQINQKATQLLGYRESELLGKDWVSNLISENERPQVKKNLDTLLNDRTKSSLSYIAPVIGKNRKEYIIEWNSAPLTDERGMVYGTINSGVDITEARRLSRELRNTINHYEPQLKKLAADLTDIKKKYQNEARKNTLARSKFRFWMDLDTILFSMTEEQKHNPVEINHRIRLILQRFGEMTRADNGFIFLFNEDQTQMANTHIWTANDPDLEPNPDEPIPLDTFPWLKKKMLDREIIHAKSLSELPEAARAEKEILESQGIKSLINVPLLWNNQPIGYLGFESEGKERAWDPDEISMLRVLAKVLAQTLTLTPYFPKAEAAEPAGPPAEDSSAKEAADHIRREYEEKLEALRQQLESQEAETRSREAELEELRQQLQEELTKRQSVESELTEERDRIEQKLMERNTELAEIRSELENRSREKENLVQQIESLKAEIDSRVEKLEDDSRSQMAEQLETQRQEYINARAELEQRLEAKTRELTELQEALETGDASRRELETELQSLNQKLSRQTQEYKALQVAHSMLQSELDELKKLQQEFDTTILHLEEKEKSIEDHAQELEEALELQKLRVSLLENRVKTYDRLPLPLFTLDAEGKITSWSRGAEEALGYREQEVIGQPLGQLLEEEPEPPLEDLLARLQDQAGLEQETRWRNQEGEIRPGTLHLTALQKETGEFAGAVAYITFPARSDEATASMADEARLLMEQSGLLVFRLGPDYEVQDINTKACELFGWNRDQVLGKNFFDLILPPDQARDIEEDVTGVLELKPASDFEAEIPGPDHQPRHLSWNLVRQEPGEGAAGGILAIGQDLTELRQAEKMIKQNEALLHSIVDGALDGFITIDENGIIQSFNPGAERIFGYTAREAVGQNVTLLMPEPYRSEHSNYINNYLVTGKARLVGQAPREFLALKKDGTTFPVEIAVREMYQDYRRLFVGVVHDITRRKSIEQSLKESEEKFRKLLAAENDAIVILNAHTQRILDVNESAAALFGYERDELVRLKLTDISVEPEKSVAAGNGGGMGHIHRMPLRYHKKKDGTVFPAQVSAGTFMVQNQKLQLRVIRDISEQVRLEESLRESQEYLHHILDHTPAAVYLKDSEGRYLLVNRQFETLFRVSGEEVQGKTDHQVFPTDLADEFQQADQKVLETGSSLESQETVLYSDGAHIFDSIKFPLRNSSGVLYGMCGILTDITQRTRLEEELRNIRNHLDEMVEKRTEELKRLQQKVVRSEKLKATSQLAGEVARQINNPIHGIRNILEQIGERVPMEEIHKSLVEVAVNECRRVADLLEKLRECHAPKAAEPETLDLHQVIEEAIEVNREKLGELVTLEKHFAKDLPPLKGSTSQIRQVIEHLIQNAEEALPEHKGRILIATEREPDKIKIHVQDTGCGIPPENLDAIFDPFFTTKTALKRNGLGLLVTLGIVKNHQGDIEVKSQPGKGTTFTITLPLQKA